ncbi:MAG: alpha/beta hydrolase [Eubacterium sp.]|nr:alpha/beta hydrolase [Eubacterium sp.]
MSKILKKIGKVILVILAILILAVAVLAIRNVFKCKEDSSTYSNAYGTYYTLSTGERINYTFYDSPSDEVAVILPGHGCSSVHYEFDAFAKGLADKYKIVMYEPLGYGLSDSTTRERSSENYCKELHELMSSLGYDRYTIIGHSISGLYSLKYANMYPEEVKAFIGIDTSVPCQDDVCPVSARSDNMYKTFKRMKTLLINTGIYRLTTELSFNSTIECIPTLSADDQKMFLAMSCTNQLNATQMNEIRKMTDNMNELRGVKFPENIPVLYMVSSDNCSMIPEWENVHSELITNPKGKVVKLNGPHYLHLFNLPSVLDTINEWNPYM